MRYPNAHEARLVEAGALDPETMRRKEVAPGVHLILGKRKGSATMEGEAYVFERGKFTPEQAKKWLSERKIETKSFEAATGAGPIEASAGFEDVSGLEILSVGTFDASKGGRVSITEADLRSIADNTNELIAAGHAPPFKLGHDDDQSATKRLFPEGGEASLGWVRSLRVEGEKLLADGTKVPSRFLAAVRNGSWRKRSPELVPRSAVPAWAGASGSGGKKAGGPAWVLKAVAWLGGTMPADTGLRDLYALAEPEEIEDSIELLVFARAEAEPITLTRLIEDESSSSSGDTGGKNVEPGSPAIEASSGATDEGSGPSSDDERNEKIQEGISMDHEKEIAELRLAIDKLSTEVERQGQEAAISKKALIDARFSMALAEGRITPADVERETPVVLKLSAVDAAGYMDAVANRPAVHAKKTGQAGVGGDPPKGDDAPKGEAYLSARARELVKEGKAEDFGEGLKMAAKEKPEEAKAYELSYALTADARALVGRA
jgi:hypothetical protein